MKRTILLSGFALLSLTAAIAPANPLLQGADPDVAVFGDKFWMYPTTPAAGGGSVFKAFSSTDLKTWDDRGVILNIKHVPWVPIPDKPVHSAWAPTVMESKGRYYLYYSVGPLARGQPSRIGVAIADKPEGPFTDSGKALITSEKGFEAIDPMTFKDPKSGITYLYAGGSNGATLRVWELGEDLVSLKRRVDVKTPEKFTEGPFMHVRNGVYYLSYSHGRWSSTAYSVHYATAPSPIGPWTYKGCVLSSDATHKGPGHHSFFRHPSTDQWFIAYHRFDTTQSEGRLTGSRKIAIEPITFDKDGQIEPIRMTDDGPPRSTLAK